MFHPHHASTSHNCPAIPTPPHHSTIPPSHNHPAFPPSYHHSAISPSHHHCYSSTTLSPYLSSITIILLYHSITCHPATTPSVISPIMLSPCHDIIPPHQCHPAAHLTHSQHFSKEKQVIKKCY